MAKISELGKLKEKRGTGERENYKPWIKAREINSLGTTANIVDWKHGRTIELLSAGEEWYYYLLRWDDRVADIREQYPLPLEETVAIAHSLGVRHPKNEKTRMTTDLLVTFEDGTLEAYSVKSTRKDADINLVKNLKERETVARTAEKLLIEKVYWNNQGVKWRLVFKDELNPIEISNIRRVVVYYDRSRVHDSISEVKHRIATKQLLVNMSEEIDFLRLANNAEG